MSKTANITEFLNSRKVELASEAVELGIVDDIQKDFAKYSKSVVAGNAKADAVIAAAKATSALYKQAISDFALVQKQIDYVKKQAADLGVDVPSSVKQAENEIKSAIPYMETRIKRLNDVMNLTQK
jgi:hypothetical protein